MYTTHDHTFQQTCTLHMIIHVNKQDSINNNGCFKNDKKWRKFTTYDAFIFIKLEYNSTIVFQILFESVLTVTLVPTN
jgi:hypothetical protein